MKRSLLALILMLAVQACAQTKSGAAMKNPPELGLISWQREIPATVPENKPLLLLFQEVPG